MNSYDLVIVGVGTMGSAALYHATRRGLKVLGVEQFTTVPHEHGSHHGTTRAIRKAYFEHPGYVPLLLRAYELWEQLQQEYGEKLLVKSGGLMIGSPSSQVFSGALLAAQRHDLVYERFTKKEIEKRYPFLSLQDEQEAVFEPDAGYLLSDVAIKAHVSQALRLGAQLQLGCKVKGWSPSGDGIAVHLPNETMYAQHLILTVGAWATEFLPITPLQIERQVLYWFEPPNEAMNAAPIYVIEEQDGTIMYGFPNQPEHGVKVAFHHGGELCTLDSIDRAIRPQEIQRMRVALSRRIPSVASNNLRKSVVCMYTNTPDYNFLVGPHPQQHHVTLGLGYSGHGFKFASVMGELLVNLSLGEQAIEVPEIFAPYRFALM